MRRWILCIVLLTTLAGPVMAAGLLKPQGSNLPDLQLEEHHVRVTINNGFAVTEVDQTFFNPNDQDLDALYTFPLPKNAALSELSLWIDGVEVVGEVVEKEEARRIVEEERAAGRDTVLAEQREYVAFDVLVSPVRAASRTRVRLVYLQPIEVDGGVGRYVYPLEEGGIDAETQAFWTRSPRVEGKFDFEGTIHSAYPLDDVLAKGFERSVVTQGDSDTWTVWIDNDDGGVDLNKDLVVYYRLAAGEPARVDLLTHRDDDGPGSYLLLITPGADLEPIVEGVDWTVVVDVSGSMTEKILTAGGAVERALGEMRPRDRFRILTFSDSVDQLTPGFVEATPTNVRQYGAELVARRAEGGTNVHAGLEAGLSGLGADRTSAVILVSDGGANVGPTEVGDFLKLLDKKDVRVFTFVMGQGANRPLLGRIAEESGGFSFDVSNRDDLYGRLLQAKAKLGREALHGVEVEIDGVPTAAAAPSRIPAAWFGQQIVVFGRYLEPGDATLTLRARISGEPREWTTRVHLPEREERFPEIERLWALARVQDLERRIDDGGERSELHEAIVGLGTEYSIVTEHTSMLVVREERFEELGIDRRNKARTDAERGARATRENQSAVQVRADAAQPMFGAEPARQHGGGGGGVGAVEPWFLLLLGGLFAAARFGARQKR